MFGMPDLRTMLGFSKANLGRVTQGKIGTGHRRDILAGYNAIHDPPVDPGLARDVRQQPCSSATGHNGHLTQTMYEVGADSVQAQDNKVSVALVVYLALYARLRQGLCRTGILWPCISGLI